MVNNSRTINNNKLTESKKEQKENQRKQDISNEIDEEDDESDSEDSESEYLLSNTDITKRYSHQNLNVHFNKEKQFSVESSIHSWIIDLSDWKIKQLFTDDDWCKITEESNVLQRPDENLKLQYSRVTNRQIRQVLLYQEEKLKMNLKERAKLGRRLDGILRTYNDNVEYETIEEYISQRRRSYQNPDTNKKYKEFFHGLINTQPYLMVMKCIEIIDEKLPDLTEEEFIQEIINGGK
ncbi:14272_t:CDS:2 [Funneliformis mosseae]|uniref:14272_t:CDS:1 n=1 Tax=Funneliformis mosseae TaxID=27381 RepID=A0A9N8W0E1_FUNMO|nr:14272_t:CDS:2 [Funneliformis mosseae]